MSSRLVLVGLIVALGLSQYQLWFGRGSISERQQLSDKLERQLAENARLEARNASLSEEITALKTDPGAIEELLRSRFGYVREGETFVRLIPERVAP